MGQSCYNRYGHDVGDCSDSEDGDNINDEEYTEKFNELNSFGELSPHGLTQFLLNLYLKRIPDDLKKICMTYLGEDDEASLDLQYPFNSTVLTTTEKYSLLQLMQRHLRNRSITFKLIYRASQDGYTAKDFHRKCDKYDYTLHVIEPMSNTQMTKLPVFGAFTSIKMTNIEKEHRDPYMLLYRVRGDYRSPKLIEPNVYHCENSFHYHRKNYVKTYTHSMISFGTKGQRYLFIDDRCDWRNNFCGDDHLTRWQADCLGHSVKDEERLYFRVKEMEVFQIEQLFISKGDSSSSNISVDERTNIINQSYASSGDECK